MVKAISFVKSTKVKSPALNNLNKTNVKSLSKLAVNSETVIAEM
jgi:hypothetical protein